MQTDSLIGKTIRYFIIKAEVGEGAMGRVYLAENVRICEKKYAVKVLHRKLTHNPSFKERFVDEARHQADLNHANVVQMYDYFPEYEDYFLVLEYVDGRSLDKIIDTKGGPLDEKQARSIIKDVLKGLNCAHERAIFHRDVKPSNVMVDKSGRARLTDFGIATQAGEARQNEAGRVIGTPAYMSPEQKRSSSRIDHRSDVYSAGSVLFEMLTGKPAFKGELQQVDTDPRVHNPKIKKGLAEIVRRAMQEDPDQRFQGCLEFLKAVENYERGRNWPIWTLCLCALLAAGIYVFKSTIHDLPVIRGVVTSASNNYALLCQEAVRLQRMEGGKRIAEESGNSDLAGQFEKRIEDINANMAKFATDYPIVA